MGGDVHVHDSVDSFLISGLLPYTIIVDNFEAEYEVLSALISIQNSRKNSLKFVSLVFPPRPPSPYPRLQYNFLMMVLCIIDDKQKKLSESLYFLFRSSARHFEFLMTA